MFKTDSSAVVVDVIVTDHKGRPVPGLTTSDFRLYEDKNPQTIVELLPPGGRVTAPRLITLVLDTGDLHHESLKLACTAAAKFAEKTLAAGNAVSIYWVDTALHLALPATRDPQKALAVIDKLSRHASFGRFSARERERTQDEIEDLFATVYPETKFGGPPQVKNLDTMQSGEHGRPSPEQQMQMETQAEALRQMNMLRTWLTIAGTLQARAVFVALRAMAITYGDLPGRKSIVLFSEGFLHTPGAGPEMQAVIDAANRSNVAIYVLDPAGLETGMGAESGLVRSGGKRAGGDYAALGARARSGGLSQFDWMQTLGTDPHGDLAVVAEATGGFLVQNTNDLTPALDRVAEDASEFYTLIYHPANRTYDGAFRNIKVEMGERAYRVRHRVGYWALAPGRAVLMTPAAAQLLASVESGEREPAFAPQVNAAMVAAPGGRFGVAAAVSFPGKLVRFEKSGKQLSASTTVLLIARDRRNELVSVHERYGEVQIKPGEVEAFASRVFNLQSHLPVPSLDAVRLQAVVRFADGTIGASEPREVAAPASSAQELRVTSLVLSDQSEDADCSADAMDPLCVKGLRLLMPAQPQFARSSRLTVYFSVLGLALDEARRPALGVSFILSSGKEPMALKPAQLRASAGSAQETLLVLADFDLRDLAPGSYTLEATAQDKLRRSAATAQAEFVVR